MFAAPATAPERPDDTVARSGLRALVAYLRPVVRSALLADLAATGLFITEWDPYSLNEANPPDVDQDLVVVFCDATSDHELIIEQLRRIGAPMLTVLGRPHNQVMSSFADAEWTWDDGFGRFHDAVREASRRARTNPARPQPLAASSSEPVVSYREDPPRLTVGEVMVPLSPAEGAVFGRLVKAAGEPVAMEHLGAREPSPMSAAYLKTIVMRLRRKLAELGVDPVMLGCVRGFGYVLRRD